MPRNPTADPRPFHMGAGPVACLLLHGFTGSPAEVRPLGEYLGARGFRVVAPLLPGHGTEPVELNRVSWADWVAAAEAVFAALEPSCSGIFVGGSSMGALVAAAVAERHPRALGLLAYSPALQAANRLLPLTPLLRHLVTQFPDSRGTDLTDPEAPARLWHYETRPVGGAAQLYWLQRAVRPLLPRVTVPSLVCYASRDRAISRNSAWRFFRALGAPRKTYAVYGKSGHNMLVDAERELIMAQTWQWMQSCLPKGALHDSPG